MVMRTVHASNHSSFEFSAYGNSLKAPGLHKSSLGYVGAEGPEKSWPRAEKSKLILSILYRNRSRLSSFDKHELLDKLCFSQKKVVAYSLFFWDLGFVHWILYFRGSSNGRMADSDSVCLGSNPSPRAKKIAQLGLFFLVAGR